MGAVQGRNRQQVEEAQEKTEPGDVQAYDTDVAEMNHQTQASQANDHDCQQEIHPRSRQSNHDVIRARVLEVVGVDGDWFGPADEEAAGREEDEQQRDGDGADKVNVHQRVERDAALRQCGVIPTLPGHPGMAELVEGQQHQQAQIEDQPIN